MMALFWMLRGFSASATSMLKPSVTLSQRTDGRRTRDFAVAVEGMLAQHFVSGLKSDRVYPTANAAVPSHAKACFRQDMANSFSKLKGATLVSHFDSSTSRTAAVLISDGR